MSELQLDYRALAVQLADLADAPHWYVGFSGGLDSTVLLHLLQQWRQRHSRPPPLTAIHINHGLQTLAGDWQLHCQRVCQRLQLPIVCESVAVQRQSSGLEAAARTARYRIFKDRVQTAEVLFLGHHLDDQVETFFLRLLRGAGVQGLAGMAPSRPLGRGQLVRPLLPIARARLEHYARQHSLPYVTDPSNCDTGLDRNFLRAEVLPLLASRWPGYRQTVARAGDHLADAANVLRQALPAPVTVYSTMGDPGVALSELVDVAPETAATRLRHWLLASGRQPPDQSPLSEFLRQLRESAEQAAPMLQCSAYTLQRYRQAVYLLPASAPREPCDSMLLAPGDIRQLPGVGQLQLEMVATHGLLLAADEAVELRWRQGGEHCKPLGQKVGSSLKNLLQQWDIPPWWRQRVPLLYLDGELLAVGDLSGCESARWRDCAPPGQSLWRLSWQRQLASSLD